MNDHTCVKCGKQLDLVNWWTAGVYNRFDGKWYKLCDECAKQVKFAMQAVIETKGNIGGVMMR